MKFTMITAAVLLPVLAAAQTTAAPLNAQDKMFIEKAAQAGMAEVTDGQLAENQGGSAVKQIGTQMVTDHTKANDQLTQLSQQLGDPAPTTETAKQTKMTANLQSLSGSKFDQTYLKEQEKAHVKAIALFKKEASNGGNADLKQFASTTLPVLEQHLSMIKDAMK